MLNTQRQGRGSSTDAGLKCPKCDVMIVIKKDHYLTCKLCEFPWHKECIADLDEDEYNVLKKNEKKKNKNIHWFCSKQCDRAANKFLSKMAGFEEEIAKVDKRVTSLDTKISTIQDGVFTEKMQQAIEEIVQKSERQGSEPKNDDIKDLLERDRRVQMEGIENMINTKTKEQIAEAESRAKRQTNLIVFKLPESKKASSGDKRQDDATKIQTLLTECEIQHKPIEIVRLGQVGKTRDGKTTDRPVRINFGSKVARDESLSNMIKTKRGLDKESGSLLLSLGFRKDMTPQEREEDAVLYKLLKQRRDESKASGDDITRWVIRNGQVVSLSEWRAARRQPEE